MQNEIWKACEGFAGYQVSNHGNIQENEQPKPTYNENGYRKVVINNKNIRVHRLVALVFCEKPKGCDVVNHLDGSRNNNHASNLEWTTRGDNTRHAAKNGLLSAGERHARTELTVAVVLAIDALLSAGTPNGAIAAQTGVSREIVSKIKAGRTWAKATGRELAPIARIKAVGKRKLTTEEVADIRKRVAAGESRRALAASYRMSHTTIGALINGQTWQ